MEKSRNFVISVGALVFLFMGWIAWIMFKSPLLPENPGEHLPQGEMTQLRHDLTDFIKKRIEKERPTSQLVDISLDDAVTDKGVLKIPYQLSFKDKETKTESSIRAVAFLEKKGEEWTVTKVQPQKEVITYDDNVDVKSAKEDN
jgi:hypothetical protein